MSTAEKIIDQELALERAGGNIELARELFGMLRREIPDYIEQVDNLYRQNDLPALIAVVHKINGGATYCGADALRIAADRFETDLKSQQKADYDRDWQSLMDELKALADLPPERSPF